MALTSYDDLKTEVASYIARSDVTSASGLVDTVIDLAEARLNKKLRCLRMRDTYSLSTVAGVQTVDLPVDFLEVYSLEFTTSPKNIEYLPSVSFKTLYGGTIQGRPTGCTLAWDGTQAELKFFQTPDAVYTLDLDYYQKIPALSNSNTTNWLLIDYPEVYLNTCLYYAFKRFRSSLAADYKALFQEDVDIINNEYEAMQTVGGGLNMRINGTVV